MVREAERYRRRREISLVLHNVSTTQDAVQKILFLDAHLRATCALDIEEFLYSSDERLLFFNMWWLRVDLKTLHEELKHHGII
jgi:hypothetical protein